MERAIKHCGLEINQRETGQRAVLHRFPDALFHRWDVLLGNGSAYSFVFKLKTRTAGERGKLDEAVAKLSVSTGLLLVFSFSRNLCANGLFVGDLRRFH